MVLDTFAETKGTRRAGTKPGFNKNRSLLFLVAKYIVSRKEKTLPPLTPPYKGGGEERQFEIKAGVLQDKAPKVEA